MIDFLEAAQVAMRLDPTLVPPDGSVCLYRERDLDRMSRVYAFRFDRHHRDAYGEAMIRFCIAGSGIEAEGGGALFAYAGELELINLPLDAPPIAQWRRWKS